MDLLSLSLSLVYGSDLATWMTTNREATVTSVKKLAPNTVAGPVLIGEHEPVTAAQVRTRLLNAVKI